MSSPLIPYITKNYAGVKRCYPEEGRRKWRLRMAQGFWTTAGDPGLLQAALSEVTSVAESDDLLDEVTRDAPELGLIVRTDFSDEPSWAAFFARLQDSEKELILGTGGDVNKIASEQLQPDNTDDSDADSEDGPPAIFRIVNPFSQQDRALLVNASNLTVLRLFNDVDIRPSPTPSPGVKRIHPPNRLVDKYGWQECYRGKHVWVYDTKSNTDQCVRVVSQSGDVYGTATGDSWRARVSHICEIQLNLSSGTIRIDFGGLDRWDGVERSRNMLEAEALMA